MLTIDDLHEYQKVAIDHQLNHDDSMLWLGTGLGKTISTLTTIVQRMALGQVRKTLIIAPLRVIQAVWSQEALKWEHTKHLRFKIVVGDRSERTRKLHEPADIYLINYEALSWFVGVYTTHYLPFDMIVFDEVSKMKTSTSIRVSGGKRDRTDANGNEYTIKYKGWRHIKDDFMYRTGLTGTPASNGLIDLHGQYLVVDGGARLFEYVTHFRDAFFKPDRMGWTHKVTKQGEKAIQSRISDITIKMDSKDYLDLPSVVYSDLFVTLPDGARSAYEDVETEMFHTLDSGVELEVFSHAAVSNKCCQISNGCAYLPESTNSVVIHNAKLDALGDLMTEANGSPVLVTYSFKSDAVQIMKRFKKYKPVNLSASNSADTDKIITKWQSGQIKMMIAHPASVAHGIDGLQHGGHIIIWYGLNWSLELYQQLNDRINRQGQTKSVSITRILASDTIDIAVSDALERKCETQDDLKDALQRYRESKRLVRKD